MKMVKLFVAILTVFFCLSSCSKDSDNGYNGGNGDNDETSYAPVSLSGKIFTCAKINAEDCTRSKTFTSSSYSVAYILNSQTMGTPTYSYTRHGNTATLKMQHTSKTSVVYGKYYTTTDVYNLDLTFTSAYGGYLSGTLVSTLSGTPSTYTFYYAEFSML